VGRKECGKEKGGGGSRGCAEALLSFEKTAYRGRSLKRGKKKKEPALVDPSLKKGPHRRARKERRKRKKKGNGGKETPVSPIRSFSTSEGTTAPQPQKGGKERKKKGARSCALGSALVRQGKKKGE